MKSRRLPIVLLCSLVCSTVCAADKITWFHSDFPPISIVYGTDKGQGAGDRWMQYLIGQLPEFEHETVVANTIRLQEEMKRRDNVCNPAYVKTPEREQFAVFSEPIVELLPNGFITLLARRPEYEAFLNERGELNLGDLLASQRFRVGVAAGRSFGPAIDQVLQTNKSPDNLKAFAAHDIFSSGLVQVANQRGLDAVIGYAIELNYVLKRLRRDSEQFWFVPIAEEPQLIATHIACSRTSLGERVIERVNEVIRAGGAQFAMTAYRAWLPVEARNYYDRQRKLTSRAKPGPASP